MSFNRFKLFSPEFFLKNFLHLIIDIIVITIMEKILLHDLSIKIFPILALKNRYDLHFLLIRFYFLVIYSKVELFPS